MRHSTTGCASEAQIGEEQIIAATCDCMTSARVFLSIERLSLSRKVMWPTS